MQGFEIQVSIFIYILKISNFGYDKVFENLDMFME